MGRFVIRDREAGNVITWFDSLEDAKKELVKYENQDKCDCIYEEGFYEIFDNEEKKIIY